METQNAIATPPHPKISHPTTALPQLEEDSKSLSEQKDKGHFSQLMSDMEKAFDKKNTSPSMKAYCCRMFKKILYDSANPTQTLNLLQKCSSGANEKSVKKLPASKKISAIPIQNLTSISVNPASLKKISPTKQTIPPDIGSTLAAALQGTTKKPVEKCDSETQESFLNSPLYSKEFYANLPEKILLRFAPLDSKSHKIILLSGLTPRIEFNSPLKASLKDIFRNLKTYLSRVYEAEFEGVPRGQDLCISIDQPSSKGIQKTALSWSEKLSKSTTLKEIYLFYNKPSQILFNYYWQNIEQNDQNGINSANSLEEISKTEEYESLIQFLANIVSGVLQQMKRRRKKRSKPDSENEDEEQQNDKKQGKHEENKEEENDENSSSESKKLSENSFGSDKQKLFEDKEIDMSHPFKQIFEKSRQLGSNSQVKMNDSKLFCEELLSVSSSVAGNQTKKLTDPTTPADPKNVINENSVSYVQPPSAINSMMYMGHQPTIFGANSNQIPLMGECMDSLQMMYASRGNENPMYSQHIIQQEPGYPSMLFASNQMFSGGIGMSREGPLAEVQSPNFGLPHPNDAFPTNSQHNINPKEESLSEKK